jgi:hypothetical protein
MLPMPEHQKTQKSTESKSSVQKPAPPRIQAPSSHPMAIIQRARINPKSLTHADVMQLQQTIGNRTVVRLLTEIGAIPSKAKQAPPVQSQELVQRQEIPEEEEPLQGKMAETVQRQEIPEEEEPLQGKFENKPEIACPSCFAAPIVQRQEIPVEEEPLQGKFETVQRQEIPEEEEPLQTKKENNTGMPDNLKAGVENLSGIDMSDVRVHYNSSKPSDVGALAYTQGTDIHVAPGQEKHLPHETWHVVQQKQGRVKPTMKAKGVSINDDAVLEFEADVMGAKVLQTHGTDQVAMVIESLRSSTNGSSLAIQKSASHGVIQRLKKGDFVEYGGLGLDVGTWIEFAKAVKKLNYSTLVMVSMSLDRREKINIDTIRAQLLVNRQIHKLKIVKQDKQRRGELQRGEQQRSILIGDNVAETTQIQSASDLLVWLVSHPAGSSNTPRDFANSQTLLKVLVKLGKEDRVIEPPEVWDTLSMVLKEKEEVKEEEEDGYGEYEGWKAGDWGSEKDEDAGCSFECPLEFRRKMSEEQYSKSLEALNKRLTGYKLVGVHATTLENLGSLMVEGVSSDKFGTARGQGKGEGFYIIPTPKGIPDLTKGERSAKYWGSFIVAVYLPDDCKLKEAEEGENVQTLEAKNKGEMYYYTFAQQEIVIPPSLLNKIILVRDPADITMADPSLPAMPTTDSAVSFLQKL